MFDYYSKIISDKWPPFEAKQKSAMFLAYSIFNDWVNRSVKFALFSLLELTKYSIISWGTFILSKKSIGCNVFADKVVPSFFFEDDVITTETVGGLGFRAMIRNFWAAEVHESVMEHHCSLKDDAICNIVRRLRHLSKKKKIGRLISKNFFPVLTPPNRFL